MDLNGDQVDMIYWTGKKIMQKVCEVKHAEANNKSFSQAS